MLTTATTLESPCHCTALVQWSKGNLAGICPVEVDTESDKAKSEEGTSDSEGSESASDSEQNDPPSSLASDAEQYELMQASYVAVGRDFHDQEDLIGSEYSKLQKLELVPERWPLARLSFSLQKCVDHLDRVLAGCCWEVHTGRPHRIATFPSPSG